MNRYYFSRRKGEYYILDRTLDTRIAKTDWREAAHQICIALSNLECSRTAKVALTPAEFAAMGTKMGAP